MDFPALSIPPAEVLDTGVLRYGDGFITAEYPPLKERTTEEEEG